MTNQVSTVQMNTEELNDLLVIIAIKFERFLESCGYTRSAIYFYPMIDELREGDNTVVLRMLRSFPGFAPFIASRQPELIQLITDNIGPIKSDI